MSRDEQIRKLFLKVFSEDGISEDVLKDAITETYKAEGYNCNKFEEIPLSELEMALVDCYNAAGKNFKDADEILEYYE